MDYKDISPELREKAKACKSSEELFALAKSEGHKLTEDELEAIAGGDNWDRNGYACSTQLFSSRAR